MESNNHFYFNVALKPSCFNQFAICGIPVPKDTTNESFTLSFDNAENYISYTNLLRLILKDLELADPDHGKYEIQHSIIFIKNLFSIMRDQFSKTYN